MDNMTEQHTRSVLRALRILRCFTLEQPDLSPSEISRLSELNKTTVHRLLDTLSAEGVLERSSVTGKYSVGPELYMIGSLYLLTTDVLKAANPVARAVNELCGEAVSIGYLDGGYVTLILREETSYGFRWNRHVGSIIPAYASGLGLPLLAELRDEDIDTLYPEERLRPVAPKTVATKTELRQMLRQVRGTGLAITSESGTAGTVSVGAVIRGATGAPVAGMSISGPIFNMGTQKCELLGQLLSRAVGLVSYRLGWKDDSAPIPSMDGLRLWWATNSVVTER
jgi:IclR family acetate operon transcriptional repressor